MPRKAQFSAEDVVTAAFELVRENGLPGLSAPAVANKMGCSTMPIYSHFQNMQALEDEIVKKAWKLSMEYKSKTYTGDVWIDQGIGYVRFSKDEPNPFILNSMLSFGVPPYRGPDHALGIRTMQTIVNTKHKIMDFLIIADFHIWWILGEIFISPHYGLVACYSAADRVCMIRYRSPE